MDFLPEKFGDLPLILQINFLLSICFLMLSLVLLSLVLFLRIYKNIKKGKTEKLEFHIQEFINNFLFDEDLDKSSALEQFKKTFLKNRHECKIAIKQLLIFNENIKGESSLIIKEIFFSLGLDIFILSQLKKKSWFEKARGLFTLRQLEIKVPLVLVEPLMNSKRNEVVQQAILYLLQQSTNNPLGFLNSINSPLTLWQQIYIENALRVYEGETPDFSLWLNHNLTSVVVFCAKMIVDHNQYENIPKMIELINHTNVEIRKQAIVSLRKIEAQEILPILIKNYSKETISIKQEILKTVLELGTEKECQSIEAHIQVDQTHLTRKPFGSNALFGTTKLMAKEPRQYLQI